MDLLGAAMLATYASALSRLSSNRLDSDVAKDKYTLQRAFLPEVSNVLFQNERLAGHGC